MILRNLTILALFSLTAFSTLANQNSTIDQAISQEIATLQKELNKLHDQNLKSRLTFEKELQKLNKTLSEDSRQLSKLRQHLSTKESEKAQISDRLRENRNSLENFQLTLNSETFSWKEILSLKHDFSSLETKAQAVKSSETSTDYLSTLNQAIQKDLLKGKNLHQEKALVISNKNGKSLNGQLLRLGRFGALFLSEDQKIAAWLSKESNGLAHVEEIASIENLEAVKKLAEGQEATATLDLSQGAAFRLMSTSRDIVGEFKAGGTTAYPLLILGIFCLLITIIKAVQLFLTPSSFDKQFQSLLPLMKEGKEQDAQELVSKARGPIKVIMQECLSHSDASKEQLEELVSETIMGLYGKLDRYLNVLSVGAAASPLLGLLGTVMGIIATFDLIAVFGTGDASRLSSGISEALITTKLGLIVAVPALVAYAILNRRVKNIIFNLERASLTFINNLKIRK